MKKALFIDRDGTIIVEPPVTEQVNSIEELEFLPYAIGSLAFIARAFDYELVMVTNQDGLGSAAYPYSTFQPIQDLVLRTLAGEGVHFADVLIDCTRPEDNAPTRKPRTGMLGKYMNGDYDLSASYVIGDRDTDVELAHNLGSKYIKIDKDTDWQRIVALLRGERVSTINRKTKETDIKIALDLDGNGKCNISTGLGFFDHLLEQIGRHGGIDLTVEVKGDLNVDEHHTIEDTAIALGECLRQALGDKRGIERYGFTLPMDDCLCSCVLDFGGRAWLVWKAEFHREKVGDVPTEMFHHFFHSLASAASMNLYIEAAGENEHHKIEGIFKSLGKAIRQAIRRDVYSYELPSSKGVL